MPGIPAVTTPETASAWATTACWGMSRETSRWNSSTAGPTTPCFIACTWITGTRRRMRVQLGDRREIHGREPGSGAAAGTGLSDGSAHVDLLQARDQRVLGVVWRSRHFLLAGGAGRGD